MILPELISSFWMGFCQTLTMSDLVLGKSDWITIKQISLIPLAEFLLRGLDSSFRRAPQYPCHTRKNKKKKNRKEEEEEEKDKKIVASPDAEIDAHWMKVYAWNTDDYCYLNLQRGPFYEANTRIFTPFLQHVAYLKLPTMKMNNTIKNSTHLNVSKVPDWNPAIWILITLKLLSNSECLAIPYFLRFSYLPNNSTSVRQLANHLNSGRSKGKKRRLNKTRDVFCETCWVSISHLDVQKTDKKEASLFLSLLVLQFCLSPTTFTCRA